MLNPGKLCLWWVELSNQFLCCVHSAFYFEEIREWPWRSGGRFQSRYHLPSCEVGRVWKPEAQTATRRCMIFFSSTQTVPPACRTSLLTHLFCDFHSLCAAWLRAEGVGIRASGAVLVLINPFWNGETNQLLNQHWQPWYLSRLLQSWGTQAQIKLVPL